VGYIERRKEIMKKLIEFVNEDTKKKYGDTLISPERIAEIEEERKANPDIIGYSNDGQVVTIHDLSFDEGDEFLFDPHGLLEE
jgi:hypothetical protein